MKSPAFQFYPNDFLGSPAVRAMSPTEIGIYTLLLCLDWNGDGFELELQNPVSIARACNSNVRNFVRAWEQVGQCFRLCDDGRWRNPRLQREREKQLAYSERMSTNGKKGGRPKAVAKPQLSGEKAAVKPTESIPSPSPTPTTKRTTSAGTPPRAVWMLPASRVWEGKFGAGSFPWGKFGRHAKPLKDHHPPPLIADRLQRYLNRTESRFVSIPRFVEMFADFAPADAGKLVDEYGCLTPFGEAETTKGLRLA